MIRLATSVALPLLLAACGASHTGGPDAAVESDAALGSDATTPPSTACLMACEQRPDQPSGFCGPEDCAAECTRVAAQSAEAQDAMEMCLLDNPLCFETLDGCVLFAMYGETLNTDVTLGGRGLSEWEGLTVVVALHASRARADVREGVVRDGALEVSLGPHDVLVRGAAPLVRGYVDLDGDGRCSEADVGFSMFSELVGDFDAPRYEAALTTSLDPDRATGVCEWFEE